MAQRIANHKIDSRLVGQDDFVNYNATITASRTSEGTYEVWHWATKVFEYDYQNKKILMIRLDYISQTTSTLIGRILRSLPESVVMGLVSEFEDDKKQQRRILSMSGMLRRYFR
jgi:hypothetical protein